MLALDERGGAGVAAGRVGVFADAVVATGRVGVFAGDGCVALVGAVADFGGSTRGGAFSRSICAGDAFESGGVLSDSGL